MLDENFSHRLAVLGELGYAIQQVQHIQELGEPVPGSPTLRHKAHDADIAKWCDESGSAIVTTDEDFTAADVRMALYLNRGVSVVWISPPPLGAKEQVERVVRHYDKWVQELRRAGGTPKLWTQPVNGRPKLRRGA